VTLQDDATKTESLPSTDKPIHATRKPPKRETPAENKPVVAPATATATATAEPPRPPPVSVKSATPTTPSKPPNMYDDRK
jgi:hypothetical protein